MSFHILDSILSLVAVVSIYSRNNNDIERPYQGLMVERSIKNVPLNQLVENIADKPIISHDSGTKFMNILKYGYMVM